MQLAMGPGIGGKIACDFSLGISKSRRQSSVTCSLVLPALHHSFGTLLLVSRKSSFSLLSLSCPSLKVSTSKEKVRLSLQTIYKQHNKADNSCEGRTYNQRGFYYHTEVDILGHSTADLLQIQYTETSMTNSYQ